MNMNSIRLSTSLRSNFRKYTCCEIKHDVEVLHYNKFQIESDAYSIYRSFAGVYKRFRIDYGWSMSDNCLKYILMVLNYLKHYEIYY